jgi:hypothetical protein
MAVHARRLPFLTLPWLAVACTSSPATDASDGSAHTDAMHEDAAPSNDASVPDSADAGPSDSASDAAAPDAASADAAIDASLPSITLTGSLAIGRSCLTATRLLSGKVLLAGGTDSDGMGHGSTLRVTELFDPTSGTFTSTTPMLFTRHNHAASLLADGRVLITGGDTADLVGDDVLRYAELYDPTTGKFTQTGDMIHTRRLHTSTLLSDGTVLIAGGQEVNTLMGTATAETYDPRTGLFSATNDMLINREYHTATRLPNGKVLIAGGQVGPFGGATTARSAEVYDPATRSFTRTGSMSYARLSHTATLLEDGRVLVAGGFDRFSGPRIAELYDPAHGTFTTTGTLSAPRSQASAAILGDGSVVIAGGNDGSTIWATVEIYQPSTGTFVTTGTLSAARAAATATSLLDGTALIAGGSNGTGPNRTLVYPRSADLVRP